MQFVLEKCSQSEAAQAQSAGLDLPGALLQRIWGMNIGGVQLLPLEPGCSREVESSHGALRAFHMVECKDHSISKAPAACSSSVRHKEIQQRACPKPCPRGAIREKS